ncbi:hypothetical protein FH972_003254 [Carpinus fangiana]|uniref:Uncharacterized protein n=1 Tax=Carpinus fangiana TaxID=176857 RepID=A0A5N6QKR7_9ROSI|nr:hypothetical protein FH972_003254 [Carpinus fangiana]
MAKKEDQEIIRHQLPTVSPGNDRRTNTTFANWMRGSRESRQSYINSINNIRAHTSDGLFCQHSFAHKLIREMVVTIWDGERCFVESGGRLEPRGAYGSADLAIKSKGKVGKDRGYIVEQGDWGGGEEDMAFWFRRRRAKIIKKRTLSRREKGLVKSKESPVFI